MNTITVAGVNGYFTKTPKMGGFVHVHHCVEKSDGIGLDKYQFVASVPHHSWGEGCVNGHFHDDVDDKIKEYCQAL